MLRLLLDEHVAAAVAKALPLHRPPLQCLAMRDFEAGALLCVADAEILTAAAARGLTLVTYDQRTIPPLLKNWAESGVSHGGVIFVDRRAIEPSDVGGLVRALCRLFDALGDADWLDRVVYLTRGA